MVDDYVSAALGTRILGHDRQHSGSDAGAVARAHVEAETGVNGSSFTPVGPI